MKILIITPVFYPQIGGGENYTMHLAIELAKRHKVIILTSAKALRGIRTIENITVNYCPYRQIFGTEVISPFSIYKTIRKLRPDIIHGNGPSVSQDIGFFLSRMLNIPMVTTYHADLNANKTISRLYAGLSTRVVLRNMHKIIVTSCNLFFGILQERGVPKGKLSVIPVGVEYEKFACMCDTNLVRQRFNLKGKKIILFVGRLDRGHLYKRLDLLIHAFHFLKEKIQNAHLMIVGGGEFITQYKSMVKLLKIQDDVSFHTEVNDDELPYYYSAADIFVLPSPEKGEGFGTVLLEAMSTGIPIIASDKCGGAFAVEDSKAGLLYRAYDVNDLSSKIIKILTDNSLALKLREKGRGYAKRYEWGQICKEVEMVYDEVLSRQARQQMNRP
jgi:glycosyltransferase involved in cell wall biosynthesis